MDENLLFKKLNFKSRRGMKETTHFVKHIFESFNELSAEQKSELIELLDLNDQDMFDIIFKRKNEFLERFPSLKKFAK